MSPINQTLFGLGLVVCGWALVYILAVLVPEYIYIALIPIIIGAIVVTLSLFGVVIITDKNK